MSCGVGDTISMDRGKERCPLFEVFHVCVCVLVWGRGSTSHVGRLGEHRSCCTLPSLARARVVRSWVATSIASVPRPQKKARALAIKVNAQLALCTSQTWSSACKRSPCAGATAHVAWFRAQLRRPAADRLKRAQLSTMTGVHDSSFFVICSLVVRLLACSCLLLLASAYSCLLLLAPPCSSLLLLSPSSLPSSSSSSCHAFTLQSQNHIQMPAGSARTTH